MEYKFQRFEETEIPYVTMDIQGNTMNMVVDTGCAVSLFNAPAISDCSLLYKKCDRVISLTAITPDAVNSGAITVTFNTGDKEVTEDFFFDNSEDFGNFQKMHGVKLHGLLGSSFFNSNNCRIDFENHTLNVE